MEVLQPDPLDALYGKVDAFFGAAVSAQPVAFNCALGCDTCCRQDLTILPIEAARVARALARLPGVTIRTIRDRARSKQACVFLDPGVGACLIYEDRPLICRSHGLAVLADGVLDHCPLNFAHEPPARGGVLDLARINEPLVLINRLAGFEGERRSMAALVQEDLVPEDLVNEELHNGS